MSTKPPPPTYAVRFARRLRSVERLGDEMSTLLDLSRMDRVALKVELAQARQLHGQELSAAVVEQQRLQSLVDELTQKLLSRQ